MENQLETKTEREMDTLVNNCVISFELMHGDYWRSLAVQIARLIQTTRSC